MHVWALRRMVPAILCASALAVPVTVGAQDKNAKKAAKPSVMVKVNPPVGFSPAQMVLTADLKGGADDSEELYCASVEWDSQNRRIAGSVLAHRTILKPEARFGGTTQLAVILEILKKTPAPTV